MSVFQDIYDSEINIHISTMWDGGYDLKLGDEMNGFKAEGSVDRWGQVAPWFVERIFEFYPDSDFTRIYRDGKRAWSCLHIGGDAE